MEVILCYTTIDTEDKANNLASKLIEEKLIACANIYKVQSIYTWKDQIHNETEWRVDFKTTLVLKDQLIARIETLHSYELPAIVAMPIEANEAFNSWVDEMTL